MNTAAGHPSAGDNATSIFWFLSVLLRRWAALAGLTLIGLLAGAAVAFLSKPSYFAESRFIPQVSQAASSQLRLLTEQLGIASGGAAGVRSVDYYAQLLRSRELQLDAITSSYAIMGGGAGDTIRGTLVELLGARGATQKARLEGTLRMLDKSISVTTDLRAGLVRLRTTAPRADLAVQVNRRLLDLLNEFNLEKRRSVASAERQFVEARMTEALQELETAEGELQRFLERNRNFQSSPQLSFEAARLQRRVELRQQVYGSLAQSYEQARIEEVRDTPIITIVDRPEGPVRRTSASVIGGGIVGALLGALLALGMVFGREYWVRFRDRNRQEYEGFRVLLRTRGGTGRS